MKALLLTSIVASVVPLGGCAIHPLPDQVTGYDTYEIVAKIRCEAREAVQNKAIALLMAVPSTRSVAELLEADRSQLENLHKMPLDPKVTFFVRKYWEAAIAYEFTFDMTEANVAGGQINFLDIFNRGTFRSGVEIGTDRSRQNVRQFQVSDTFGRLIAADIYCRGDGKGPNFAYPIVGSINIAEPIKQFIDLNEFQNLTGLKNEKVPTFTESLSFQTTVSGSATPQVTLSPVVAGITDASLTLSAKRVDIHRLYLGFSLPIASNRAAPFVTAIPVFPTAAPGQFAGAKSAAELRALAAIQQARIDQFLNRGSVAVLPVQ